MQTEWNYAISHTTKLTGKSIDSHNGNMYGRCAAMTTGKRLRYGEY